MEEILDKTGDVKLDNATKLCGCRGVESLQLLVVSYIGGSNITWPWISAHKLINLAWVWPKEEANRAHPVASRHVFAKKFRNKKTR